MPERVVILGGGFAGLAFVRGLRSRRAGRAAAVTLVDRNPYHTLLPDTHWVAAGQRAAATAQIPYPSMAGFTHWLAEVKGVDPQRRVVETSAGPLPYDWLVLALGGQDRDFGIAGVRAHAQVLRTLADAERIRLRLGDLPPGAPVVVVGGGLTGVELAAEFALRRRAGGNGDPAVTLAEAGPNLLPGLPALLQRRTGRRLAQLGVAVMTEAPVSAVLPDRVRLRDGRELLAAMTVWCAGVGGHPLVRQLGLAADPAGRALVDPHLRAAERIYVVGDSAAVAPAPGAPALAPSAQLAAQMGRAAGRDLAVRLAGGAGYRFRPRHKGVLFTLGGHDAAGVMGRIPVLGRLAGWCKRLAMLQHVAVTLGWRPLLWHLGWVRPGARAPIRPVQPERRHDTGTAPTG